MRGYIRMNRFAGGLQRKLGRSHHAPLVHLGVGLGGPQAGFGDLQVLDDFRQSFAAPAAVPMTPASSVISVAKPSTNSHLATFLVTTWWPECRCRLVASCRLLHSSTSPQQEHVFPRHEDVVEEGHGVQFLEAGAQRVVEVGTARSRSSRGTDSAGRARCWRWRKRRRRAPVPGRGAGAGRGGIQRNLLGQRGQRRQHPRAVDIYPGVGLLLDPERDVCAVFQRRRAGECGCVAG